MRTNVFVRYHLVREAKQDMYPRQKLLWLTMALGVAAAFLANCNKSRPPESRLSGPPESFLLHVLPVPKGSPTITLPALNRLMHEDFVVVRDVQKLPEPVKVSFCNIEKCNFVGVKFDMVNPGEPMSTDDIIPGVPNKQLRFAVLNDHSAVVFYKWGGFADELCVTAFDFREHSSWGASLKAFRVDTLDQLRTAISERQFTQWSQGNRR